MKRRLTSLVLLLCACGGGVASHNLGDTADALATVGPTDTPVTDFVGTWIGEAEDPLGASRDGKPATYRFPSGSAQIRLDIIDASGNGLLTFGAGPAPTFPDRTQIAAHRAAVASAYPPGVDYLSKPIWNGPQLPPVEGYAYSVEAPTLVTTLPAPTSVAGGILGLEYSSYDAIAPWCTAQEPLPDGNGGYGCAGSFSVDSQAYTDPPQQCFGADGTAIDCGKVFLCAPAVAFPRSPASPNPPCMCNHAVCEVDYVPGEILLSRDGDDLVGVFTSVVFLRPGGTLGGVGQVRFHRE
jgi:hypothetical protein